MRDIPLIAEQDVNLLALDAEMRAAFGGRISGISAYADRVVVHVLEPAAGDVARAEEVLLAHNPHLVRVSRPMAVDLQTKVEPIRRVRALWR
ncbi:MAG: hypothetical protein GX484_05365 [Chloroflexi bacterium]|nr:hypothetical protein [Chloroflexota bacterium]